VPTKRLTDNFDWVRTLTSNSPLFALSNSVELCSHKLHVFLPGRSPMPVCFHKRQQVFEAVPGE